MLDEGGIAPMESDLDKARKIVGKRERWVGVHGALQDNIAEAVAEGIALGRKEGLETAALAVKEKIAALHVHSKPRNVA